MPRAERATVAPRACSPWTDAVLRLDDVVLEWLAEPGARFLAILGGPGTGKTTALRHLATWIDGDEVELVDDPGIRYRLTSPPRGRRRIFTARHLHTRQHRRGTRLHTSRLAPWDRDALLEWLLPHGREVCASVIARLETTREPDWPAGNPELWTCALRRMAADGTVPEPAAAVIGRIEELAGNLLPAVQELGRAVAFREGETTADLRARLSQQGAEDELLRLLRHPAPCTRLGAAVVVDDLCRDRERSYLGNAPPLDALQEVAAVLERDDRSRERLGREPPERPSVQPLYHSVMHRVVPGWRPPRTGTVNLRHADLEGVRWSGVDLNGSDLGSAHADHADLDGADLRQSCLRGTRLRHARLREANLHGATAPDADLTGADLRRAGAAGLDLRAATLRRANLEEADLHGAGLIGTDLEGARMVRARLDGSCLLGATLSECDLGGAVLRGAALARLDLRRTVLRGALLDEARLEEARLDELDLEGASLTGTDLRNAHLTGSRFPAGRLAGADLRGAGLAHVDWPGVDLRGADLRGAVFAMGSTRSGLVGSTIPSEGSRTGFYTDDSADQDFLPPEEIRRANLRGADLTGALLEGADLYLVDLRGVRCNRAMRAHLRKAGAIL